MIICWPSARRNYVPDHFRAELLHTSKHTLRHFHYGALPKLFAGPNTSKQILPAQMWRKSGTIRVRLSRNYSRSWLALQVRPVHSIETHRFFPDMRQKLNVPAPEIRMIAASHPMCSSPGNGGLRAETAPPTGPGSNNGGSGSRRNAAGNGCTSDYRDRMTMLPCGIQFS